MDPLNRLIFTIIYAIIGGFLEPKKGFKYLTVLISINLILFLVLGFSNIYFDLTLTLSYLFVLYMMYNVLLKKRYDLSDPLILFFGSSVLSLSSYGAGGVLSDFSSSISDSSSILNPQNLWHTPFFGIIICLIFTVIICKIWNRHIIPTLALSFTGYWFYIVLDSLTYGFKVWWLFPFTTKSFSLLELASRGEMISSVITNQLGYVFLYIAPALIIIGLITAGLWYLSKRETIIIIRGRKILHG